MAGRLERKVVVISAAAAGIGEAVTRRFATEGATLWINDLRGDRLDDLISDLRTAGHDITGMTGDASDQSFVDDWIAGAIASHGRIDVLYNNVGIGHPGVLVGDISDSEWHLQQRLTLDSVFYATRAVLPHMIAQRSGSIISMSSGAGVAGEYGLGAYAAAKAGVINLMETVAMEYGPYGIRANAVTPGPTATAPLLAWVNSQAGGEAAHARELDLQRLTRPDEVAGIVLFLASDDSSSITGNCIRSNIRAGRRPL